MIKKIFSLLILFFFAKDICPQKYFKIEGTKRIFTYYGKKRSSQISDTTTLFFYVKNNNFYLASKTLTHSISPYVKYNILPRKEKAKVKSVGRGTNNVVRVSFIYINIIKAEKITGDSEFIEEIIKR